MAGQVIIGKVAVKVMPDLDGFAATALKELKKAERRLPKLNVKVGIESPDTAGIRRELERLKQRIGNIDLGLEIGLDEEMRQRLEQQLRDIQDDLRELDEYVANPEVKPRLDESSYLTARLALARLARTRTVVLVPRVSGPAAAKAAATLSALSGLRVLDSTFSRFKDFLRDLDKTAPIIGSLMAAVQGLAGWLATAGSNLFTLSSGLAQIGPLALALPGIFGGFAVGLGATYAVLKDFNKVLPEVADKFHRLQDAMSAEFWSIAADPIRDMINTLFPAFERGLIRTSTALGNWFTQLADGLVDAFPDEVIDGMFDDLVDSINIAAEATDSFADILAILGRVGAGYLPRLAAWFRDITDQFAAFLTKADADGRLEGWIDRGIERLKELGVIIRETGGILTGLARAAEAAGGSTLDDLAKSLERIHDTVDSPAFQTGLIRFLESAHRGMEDISRIAGPSMVKMFDAISESSVRTFPLVGEVIGRALRTIGEVIADPSFQRGFEDALGGAASFMLDMAGAAEPLAEILGEVGTMMGKLAAIAGDVLGAALPYLADVMTALGEPVRDLITTLGAGLVDAINVVGPIFVQLAEDLVPVIDRFAQLADESINNLLPALGPLVEAFAEIALALAEGVLGAITALAPHLPALAESFTNILEAAAPLVESMADFYAEVLPALIPLIIQLADNFANMIPSIVKLLDAFTKLASVVGPVLIPVIRLFVQVIGTLVDGVINGLGNVVSGVADALMGTWQAFAGLFTADWQRMWQGIKTTVIGIWNTILGAAQVFFNVTLLGAVRGGLLKLLTSWRSGWTGIKSAGIAIWRGISAGWTKFWSTVLTKGKSAVNTIKNAVSSGFKSMASAIKSRLASAKASVSSAWSSMTSTIKSKLSSIKSSVTSAWNSINSTIKSKLSSIKSGITSAWNSMLSAIKSKVSSIKSSISSGFQSMVSTIKSRMSSAKAAVSSAMSSIQSKFRSGISSVKSTVSSGFRSVVSVVKSSLSSMASAVSSGVSRVVSLFRALPGQIRGAVGNLSGVLTSAGRQVIDGFIGSISAGFGRVKSKLGSLTSMLPSWKGPPSTDRTILRDAGTLVIDGFIDGLQDRFAAVRATLRDLTNEVEGTEIAAPALSDTGLDSRNMRKVQSSIETGNFAGNRTFNYYAAEGSSLGSEEDLFEAMERGRGGW